MNVETRLNTALAVRDQFLAIPPGWHYLDSAATAQKPQAVIDAITQAYGRDYATVHRGVYERSAAMTQSFEAAAARAASLIGGKEEEVIFTRGATRLIASVAPRVKMTSSSRPPISEAAAARAASKLCVIAAERSYTPRCTVA